MAQEPNQIDISKATEAALTINELPQVQKEQKAMFELELRTPDFAAEVEAWADKTCISKRSLRRFLATLTPAQLAQAEVIVDDDSFTVFYPILAGTTAASGAHFDGGEAVVEAPCSQPELQPEPQPATMSQDDWDKALQVLLSSVKLI